MGGSDNTGAGFQTGGYYEKPYGEPSAQPYLHNDAPPPYQETYEPLDPARAPEDNDKFHFGGCRDLFFVILFIAGLAGFFTVFGYGIVSAKTNIITTSYVSFVPIPPALVPGFVKLLSICVGVSISFTIAYLILVRLFPMAMIVITLVLNVLAFLALGIFFFVAYRNYIVGILFILFTLFWAWCLYSWRSRIRLAKILLKHSMKLIGQYPGTMVVSYFYLLIQIAFMAAFVIALANLQYSSSTGVYIVQLIFIVFIQFWVLEVIRNVVHVSVCGVVATWYFLNGRPEMPRSPTMGAAWRASTTSFGSICFGSLLIAIIQTLRWIANALRNNKRLAIIACLIDCFLSCLEGYLRLFNRYAYVQVAIYGKSYCQAAKDTGELFIEGSGWESLVNDNLIGSVIGIGVLIGGALSGIIAYFLSLSLVPGYFVLCVLLGIMIGIIITGHALSVLDSTIVSLFVCVAMQPGILAFHSPHLASKIYGARRRITV